jgi:bifunctional non-homologous end joining protein LigD
MKIGGHEIEITNAERVLFPDSGITKGDLVEYYQRIAEIMLPHLKDRPLSIQRFPSGIEQSGFYQKEVPDYFPEWIDRVDIYVEQDEETQPQVVCSNAETLVYLANQGTITLHAWLSRAAHLRQPDRVIFDLDPPDDKDFEAVRDAARLLREMLEEVNLASFVMTTGSRGLHVLVPLQPLDDFDAVRDFARDLCELAARRWPERLTTEVRKEKRQGRLFLDYLRNAYAQTAIAPYTVRAKPGAPVAVPLDWEELSSPSLKSDRYTLGNIFRRLANKADPWKDIMERAHKLKPARQRMDDLLGSEDD